MKKRNGIVLLLSLALTLAPAAAQDRVDLVVLLDSSKSMFQYYNQVVDYVLSETVREYMRFGDAFHLLSFSDSTQVEIAQVLRTEQDLRSVVARLYLLYPLGRNTDLVTAIKNVYQYVSDLPEGSAKRIILITDGMHSPAPGSTYENLDATAVRTELDHAAAKIRERGWTMRIVRVPFDGPAATAQTPGAGQSTGTAPSTGSATETSSDPSLNGEAEPSAPGSGDYLDVVASAIGAEIRTFDPENASAAVADTVDLPRIEFPASLGSKGYSFSIPVEVANRSSRPLSLELTGLLLEDGSDVLAAKAFAELLPGKSERLVIKVALPDSLTEGATTLSLEPRFADGLRVSPARSIVSVTLKRSPLSALFRNSARVALFFVMLAIACSAVLIVVLYVRRVHRRAETPIVDALLDSAAAPAPARHVSPYATAASAAQAVSPASATSAAKSASVASAKPITGQATRALTESAILQPPSRDDAAVQAALLAAAKPSNTRTLSALVAHQTPRQDTASAGSGLAARRDEARAASVLGSWKTPGSSRRRLPTASEVAYVAADTQKRTPPHYEPRVTRPGAVRLVLHVRDQNPNIGKRNIRALHAGGRASVGGGTSDFLVFLLPVPKRVAHLYFDGVDATLVPVKPEYFPDYDGAIEACIGREIRVVTARGKELFLRFERYVAPLDRINKLLHCLETPGMTGPATTIASVAAERAED